MHYSGLSAETVQTMISVKNDLEHARGERVTSWREVARHITSSADYWSRAQALARVTPGRGRIGLRASQLTSAARDLMREDRKPRPARSR